MRSMSPRRCAPLSAAYILGFAVSADLLSLTFLAPQSVGVRLTSACGASGCVSNGAAGAQMPSTASGLFHAAAMAGAIAAAGLAVCRQARVARRGGDGEWLGAEKISALTESVGSGVCDNIEIAKILPHRYPFLLVDKVISLEKMKRAVGVKNVTANEPQFTGHFPENPIMPGVLMVEALAQLAGVVCMNPGDQVLFAGIDGVKFKRKVVPGDTLVMEVEVLKFREKIGIAKMSGKAYVDGELAVKVKEFTCALVKEENKN